MFKSKLNKPIALPQGDAEMIAFADTVLSAGGFPVVDGMRAEVAKMLLHTDADADPSTFTPAYFINALRRSIANAAAFNLLEDVKERAKAAAAEKAADAESTKEDATTVGSET